MPRILIWAGLVGLAITVTLHLTLGVPPIDAGVKAGFFKDAPGMTVAELKGIWIAFSLIYYCLLAGLAFALLSSAQGLRLLAGTIGATTFISALALGWLVSFSHIALPLLLVPSLLLIGGALLSPNGK